MCRASNPKGQAASSKRGLSGAPRQEGEERSARAGEGREECRVENEGRRQGNGEAQDGERGIPAKARTQYCDVRQSLGSRGSGQRIERNRVAPNQASERQDVVKRGSGLGAGCVAATNEYCAA